MSLVSFLPSCALQNEKMINYVDVVSAGGHVGCLSVWAWPWSWLVSMTKTKGTAAYRPGQCNTYLRMHIYADCITQAPLYHYEREHK